MILDYDIIDDDYTNPRYYYRCDCEKSKKGINSEESQNTNSMEKVTINGKEYQIDIEKCKEQGLLKEEKSYPEDWIEFSELLSKHEYEYKDWGILYNDEEQQAFIALGKLIQLRDWWWDNMCDGWRPDWNENIIKYGIKYLYDNLDKNWNRCNMSMILTFPTPEIRDKFIETYRDLIEEAKMFL